MIKLLLIKQINTLCFIFYILIIQTGKQSAGARNLSPEEQTVYNMIRETKGMGKLMYHLNQETKIKAPSINAKLKKVVESLINKKLVKKIHSIKYGKKVGMFA